MPTRLCCLRLCLATALGLALAATAQAQGVYRCGNTYSAQPCPGGTAVAVDDARTADQQQQAHRLRIRAAARHPAAAEHGARARQAAARRVARRARA